MELDSFAERVKEDVKEKLGAGWHVAVQKVDKNNGVTYTGLCVSRDGEQVSPVVYINDYYDTYKNGNATPLDAAEYVADVCRKKRHTVDVRYLLDYGNVRSKIVYKLVNTEKNREALEDLPHKAFLDLSIVFQCMVEHKGIGSASVLIHNAHAKLWGVSVEELYRAATENTPRLRGYELKSMEEMIHEIMQRQKAGGQFDGDGLTGGKGCSFPMYVLSNVQRTEGAACILYPNFLKDFAEAIGGGFYIIPSSIHEVLILPEDIADGGKECDEIREMIREVNDTQVLEEELLSYSLYHYDAQEDEVRVCA